MRPIKFRVWDKKYTIMLDPEAFNRNDIWIGGDGSVYEIEEWSGYSGGGKIENNVSDQYILMQYTGLKDKEGGEIYEGDVVTLTKHDEEYVIQGNGYLDVGIEKGWNMQGEVKFLYNCWFIDERDEKGCPLDFEGEKALKIIGNIYQNKELIS